MLSARPQMAETYLGATKLLLRIPLQCWVRQPGIPEKEHIVFVPPLTAKGDGTHSQYSVVYYHAEDCDQRRHPFV